MVSAAKLRFMEGRRGTNRRYDLPVLEVQLGRGFGRFVSNWEGMGARDALRAAGGDAGARNRSLIQAVQSR